MKKIVYLPLDERPCNADFVPKLFGGCDLNIVSPAVLGDKKTPAEWESLHDFLVRECKDADGLILSMDTLLYGGLIPSRLHQLSEETVLQRLNLLRTLRENHPSLLIYAFQCIMRCPRNSSSDEEPDYYEDYGAEIHLLGAAEHREKLGLATLEEVAECRCKVPQNAWEDYVSRRAFNLSFNLRTLDMLHKGLIDFLIIPQDDSARYGLTAMDQEKVRAHMAGLALSDRVLMYPGADEIGLILTSRMALHFAGRRPRVYVKYAATGAPFVIPLYEDRPLGETVKYHLTAAGCRVATSLSEADFVLGLSAPGSNMREAAAQPVSDQGYQVERTLMELMVFLRDALDDGKIVIMCDNAYANGADLELIALMDQMKLMDRVHGYAGWNTSANTLGTAIAEGVHAFLSGMTDNHRDFIALRYVEDAGYCGYVRGYLCEHELPQIGLNYFDAREQRGAARDLAKAALEEFVQQRMPSIAEHISINDAWMPWKRMFEIGLDVSWK